MGIHGNATCVMNYDGAKGWLVGEPEKGLAAMFIMMNAARLGRRAYRASRRARSPTRMPRPTRKNAVRAARSKRPSAIPTLRPTRSSSILTFAGC